VTHDRYFMDQNCDVIWSFSPYGTEIVTFADTIQWEEWHRQQKKNPTGNLTADTKKNSARTGLSYKEKLEFEKMESVIAKEEALLKSLQEELQNPATQSQYSRLSELAQLIAMSESKIEKLFLRWTELTEKNS
jgi:ATP-binding cassette subfamily F protein uup